MPIGFITAMLAASEFEYQSAKRSVKAGLLGNAGAQKEKRDFWWSQYHSAKGKL